MLLCKGKMQYTCNPPFTPNIIVLYLHNKEIHETNSSDNQPGCNQILMQSKRLFEPQSQSHLVCFVFTVLQRDYGCRSKQAVVSFFAVPQCDYSHLYNRQLCLCFLHDHNWITAIRVTENCILAVSLLLFFTVPQCDYDYLCNRQLCLCFFSITVRLWLPL